MEFYEKYLTHHPEPEQSEQEITDVSLTLQAKGDSLINIVCCRLLPQAPSSQEEANEMVDVAGV